MRNQFSESTCRWVAMAWIVGLAIIASRQAQAGISYTTVGGSYLENFDNIAIKPGVTLNNALQATGPPNNVYADGWQDDVDPAVSPQDDISVPGWHLYHPANPGAPENGVNNNQRLRVGTGGNTGSFWLFAEAPVTTTERALGSLGSTTVAANGADMFIGLQLINNTGQTLHSFTLTFDGEQWRDGQSPTGETLSFAYSTVATDELWTLPGNAIFTPAPALNFTSPVAAGTGASGNAVNGNVEGRQAGITATVTGFTWEPGKELWLRWADPQLAGNADDGLAIDNVTFSATTTGTGSSEITTVAAGPNASSAGGTWSDGQAPGPGKKYRIQGGHAVNLDSAFAGDYIRVASGGTLNVNDAGNGQDMRVLILDAGATLSESATGDFVLGDSFSFSTLGIMTMASDQTFAMDAGSDFRLAMAVHGEGNLTFNSNGAGSDLVLHNVSNLNGIVKFEGTGDRLRLIDAQQTPRIEMNSTGANTLSLEHRTTQGGGSIIFNQPGTLAHATTFTTTNVRLVQKSALEVNAAVTVDMSLPYNPGERRLNFTDAIRGPGNITVVGSDSDPTSLPANVTLNEFELGSTGDASGALPNNTYTGTLTAQKYVNVELRNGLPGGKLVVQDNARLEVGRQVVGTTKNINFGEVDVQAGGTLEIGFEQVDLEPDTGHQVGHLNLVATSGRPGSLKLTNGDLSNPGDVNSEPTGSLVVMQLNGKNAGEFDTITAQGGVQLDGVLKVLINPKSSLRSAATPIFNPVYTPALGDEITLITSTGGVLATDFNHNNVVDDPDFAIWKGAFGPGAGADANGDGDSDGADFLAWQADYGKSAVGGGITGTFDRVVFLDVDNATAGAPASDNPDTATPILVNSQGVMASLGLRFQIQYSSTAVKLVVVNSPITAIPEPAAASLAAIALVVASTARRRRVAL